MLKRIKQCFGVALLGIALVASAGCAVPSLHGLAEGAAPVFEEALLGKWTKKNSAEFVVTPGADSTYLVAAHFEEDDDPPVDLQLSVTMIEISGQRFVDVRLSKEEIERAVEHYGTLIVPVHLFYRLDLGDGEFTLYRLKRDRLTEFPAKQELQHLDGAAVITASPERTRQVLASLGSDSGAWDKAFHLTRKEE